MARKVIKKQQEQKTEESAELQLPFIKPEYVSVGPYEISFNEKNVRKMSKRGALRLKKKILEGVYEPLKVWKLNNIVLSGNQRLAIIRSLIEDDGYDIPLVDVAIYDVDERVAKFIELSSNEHDGEYDFDKLMEEWDDISEMGLEDILDPRILKKMEVKVSGTDQSAPPPDSVDLRSVTGDMEVDRGTITISNVPKTQMALFHDTIDRIGKLTGLKREWDCIRVMLRYVNEVDADELMESLEEEE
jgi:hypothetical protein